MFRLQYSIERTSAAIGRLSTKYCVLYTTFAVKYKAQYPVYAMPSEVPVKYNKITTLAIQAAIFHWAQIHRCWWYVDNSMRVIHHFCCQMQPISSRLRYVNAGPSQIQYNCCSCHSGFNIQLNVSPLLLVVYRQIDTCYTPQLLPNTGHISLCALRQLDDSVKLNVITDLHIEASVINWTYFRCNCRYGDNSMIAVRHLCSKMQPKFCGSCYVNSGPSQIQ
jgi:hypothetical protein